MKNNSKKNTTFGKRYSEAEIKQMTAYCKGHTNQEVKAKFGCSAHYAGKLRKKAKIPLPESSKPVAPKKSAPAKKSGKPAKSLL